MVLALEFVKLAVVGLIAGLFSSYLANRDHRTRKWWELRVEAYRGAIEALSDIVYYYNRHFDAELEQRELSEAFKAKMTGHWDVAYPLVRRHADSGAFLFSDRANGALKEFMRDEHHDSYFEMLDHNLFKSRKCLRELVDCSKEDLKLKEGWLARWLS